MANTHPLLESILHLPNPSCWSPFAVEGSCMYGSHVSFMRPFYYMPPAIQMFWFRRRRGSRSVNVGNTSMVWFSCGFPFRDRLSQCHPPPEVFAWPSSLVIEVFNITNLNRRGSSQVGKLYPSVAWRPLLWSPQLYIGWFDDCRQLNASAVRRAGMQLICTCAEPV